MIENVAGWVQNLRLNCCKDELTCKYVEIIVDCRLELKHDRLLNCKGRISKKTREIKIEIYRLRGIHKKGIKVLLYYSSSIHCIYCQSVFSSIISSPLTSSYTPSHLPHYTETTGPKRLIFSLPRRLPLSKVGQDNWTITMFFKKCQQKELGLFMIYTLKN